MSQAGLLLQVDGSRHDWLESRGPTLTLVGGIDDATGTVTGAVFREQEDAAGYFGVLIKTAARHGLPVGLYSDRHGIFWKGRSIPTLAEQFAGRHPTTQRGRALEAAGIAWIAARSPQGAGGADPGSWHMPALGAVAPPAGRNREERESVPPNGLRQDGTSVLMPICNTRRPGVIDP